MSEPIKLPPPAVEDYDMELWGQNVRVDLYTAKQVLTAVQQATAELRAERDALRAEVARLTTLRPASEHDTQKEALWWHSPDDFHGASYFRDAPYWTPLPDVQEVK